MKQNEMLKDEKFEIDFKLFIPAITIVLLLLIWGFVDNDGFGEVAILVKGWIIKHFASTFILIGAIISSTVIVFALSPAGRIRFGGKEAKPEFSNLKWYALMLCGSIAVGIVFWGAAEPMTFYANPPASWGVEPKSIEAAVKGLSVTYAHWGFNVYSLHMIFALGIGYATYNKGLPFKMSSTLYPIVGDKIYGPLGTGIDIICVFSMVASGIPSFVFATMQLSAGLDYFWDVPNTTSTWIIIIAVITVTCLFFTYSGLKKGIAYLSDFNFWVYVGLLAFIIIAGPTVFLLDLGVESFGMYMSEMITGTMKTDPFGALNGWVGNWTAWYWCWWLCGAQTTGIFVARVSRGRTIREIIFTYVVCTSLFGIIWLTVMGGASIYQDYFGIAPIWQTISDYGVEIALFTFLEQLPLAKLVGTVIIVAIFASFSTFVNAILTTLSLVTSKMSVEASQKEEPPAVLKITWGILFGGLTIAMMLTESMSAVQTIAVLMGLPLAFYALFLIYGLVKEIFINKDPDMQQS